MFYPATGHGTVWCFCRDCVSPDAQALVGEIIVQPEALVHEQHSCVHLAVGVTVGCQCTGVRDTSEAWHRGAKGGQESPRVFFRAGHI